MERAAASPASRKHAALVSALLTISAFTLTMAWDTPAADAYCSGAGRPEPIYEVWGYEVARGGDASTTCDGDRIYRGNVADTLTDGSCVTAQYYDNGQYFNQATSCNSSGVAYTFNDQNSNNNAYVRICRNQGCGPWYYSYGY